MTKHNINFSGANIGGVNIDSIVTGSQIGTQHNYASEKNIAQAAEEIQALLQQLQQTYPNDIEAAVENKVRTDPHFHERLLFMLQEGAFETLKTIFPPVGIPIALIRGWVEAKPVQAPKEGLPPGGF